MVRALVIGLAALCSSGCYLSHENASVDGSRLDAGNTRDSAVRDSALRDSAVRDSATRDATTRDSATPDSGARDAGIPACDPPGTTTAGGACEVGCEAEVRCASEASCCRFCVCDPAVVLEPGEYFRGSPLDESGRDDDEVRHLVRLTRAFEMDRTEVTQAAWALLMGTSPSNRADCTECPVDQVNRYEAMLFANARSDADGLARCYAFDAGDCNAPIGLGCPPGPVWNRCMGPVCAGARPAAPDCEGWRLPTEAEWEYAARGGSDTAFPAGNDAELANVHGWCGSAGGMSHPVGLKRANPFGLLDILGNVYEWTEDAYGSYPTGAGPLVDPLTRVGDAAVIRGGSFAFGDNYCRSANRGAREASSRENVVGFRLVRTLP